MAKLPTPKKTSKTVQAIWAFYENKPAKFREHLGGSLIGRDCSRELWYSFRWCVEPEFSGRILRLFQTGFREEPRVIGNLRAIGVEVHDVDPATKRQFYFSKLGGHFAGSQDGAGLGFPEAPKTWHLIEIKTHNAKSFRQLQLHGVKMSKPAHWHQMQTYMGFTGLRRAMYFAINKDNDDLYTERLRYDKDAYAANLDKARRIITAQEPLAKAGEDEDAFACKWCDYKAICHGGQVSLAHCRTCAHSTPIVDGEGAQWRCEHHDKELTFDAQQRGCEEHLYIPALIPFATPVDSGDGWVEYQTGDDDRHFLNCTQSSFPANPAGHYTSAQLITANPETIGHEKVEMVRATFKD